MSMIDINKLERYSDASTKIRQQQLDDVMNITDLEVEDILGEDDIEEKSSFVFSHLSEDSEKFNNFVGFSIEEFEYLYSILEDCIVNNGRGRKPNISPKDMLVLFLHYLRRYPRLEELSCIFNVNVSTLQTQINRITPLISNKLEEKFITEIAQTTDVISDDNFPDCGYVVDATVQEINKPALSWEIAKTFFSGKHHIYCLKSQVITTLNGTAVHIKSGIPGSQHDKKLFDSTYQDFSEKVLNFQNKNSAQKIIGDKGYQDSSSSILVTPFKGTIGEIDHDQYIFNDNLSKIRIIIENFFGRLKMRYAIMSQTYRSSNTLYKYFFTICAALVNYEIIFCEQPLRKEDLRFYQRQLTKIIMKKREKIAKEKKHRKWRKDSRQHKFITQLACIDDD